MIRPSAPAGILDTSLSARRPFSATLLRSADELAALEPEWAALRRRVPAATPFQSPAWLLAWWRHLGGGELLVVAVRDGIGCLVGLAPLFIYADGSVRRLMPIGIGISDYLDILLDPSAEEAAAAALFARLRQERDRWDVVAFEELNPSARLFALPCPPGWRDEVADQGGCPVLTLPKGAARIEDAIPRSKLYDLRLARNRAARRGEVSLERADARVLGEQLEALLRLHAARWATRGEPGGVLASPKVQDFHREAAPRLLAAGILRLYALRIDGEIVGSYYGFHQEGRAYAYLTGFDPAYEFESPGTVILAHAIEAAMREGAREFHMLRGGEPYKYAWGAVDRPNRRRCFSLADGDDAA
jgi:CelD/BcsL family acetyltransferase involved in cellulose biosynthesis